MTNSRVVTTYPQPNAAAAGHAQASVGDININIGSVPQNSVPQTVHMYAAEETSHDRFLKGAKGFQSLMVGTAAGTAALIGGLALYQYSENKADSFAGKLVEPDINNTTLTVPATRVNNYIRPQTDGSAMRKMQESIDSLKANGQEVLLLPPSAADTLAAAPAIPRDTVPGFKPVGM